MIFVDPTEERHIKLDELDNAVISPHLEELTGADLMVSLQGFPATTEALIRDHVRHGAYLIQRKYRHDIAASVGERLNLSLARMRDTGARQAQCVLLCIGVVTCTLSGHASIDGNTTQHQYWPVWSARKKWCDRGGVAWPSLSRQGLLAPCLQAVEKHMREYERSGEKYIVPALDFPPDDPLPDDPLQLVRPVLDGRRVLAAFEGIGPVRANQLYGAIAEWNVAQCPADRGFTDADRQVTTQQLIVWAAMEDPDYYGLPKPPGWGMGTRMRIREQLGLLPGQDLCIRTTHVPEERTDGDG